MSFSLLDKKIRELLKERGFKQETEIQWRAIPLILTGKNVLIISRTGTGKTEAALLPLFSKMLKEVGNGSKGITLLYITPLRSLNRDLLDRIEWWSSKLGLSTEVRHGDTSQGERRKQAMNPPDILITTPETLQAILPGKVIRERLKSLKYVVIDEIHELVEEKRGAQLSIALERLEEISPGFQRIGLSATIGSPKEVAEFLVGPERECEVVVADEEKGFEFKVELIEDLKDRLDRILQVIEESRSTLIFCNTRETAEALGSRLKKLGARVEVHHSSLSREVRTDAERKFKSGEIKALICTSSMELGIDVGSVDVVIQYMSPRQVTRLIQRVGRSGHRIGEVSRGILISTDPEDALESIVISCMAKNGMLERTRINEGALDVLAHQISGICLDFGKVEVDKAFHIIKRSYPYRRISKDEFMKVLKFMDQQRILFFSEDEGVIYRRKRTWEYYYSNLSMIPDYRRVPLIDLASRRKIAELDEEFVLSDIEVGSTLICKGEFWKVIEIQQQEGGKLIKVVAERTDSEGETPSWEGEMIPVMSEVSEKVFEIRASEERLREYLESSGVIVNEESISRILDFFKECPEGYFLEVRSTSDLVLHVPGGSRANEALSKAIASLLTYRTGSVATKATPYSIQFKTRNGLEAFREVIKGIEPRHLESILELAISRTSLFKWVFLQVAKRFGMISDVPRLSLDKLIEFSRDTPVYEETLRELFFDKLDVKGAEKIIRTIRENGIPEVSGPLSFSVDVKFHEIVPQSKRDVIIEAMKKRILSRRVGLICAYCLEWSGVRRIGNLDDEVRCPKCGSMFIGVVSPDSLGEAKSILRRSKTGDELTDEERRILKRVIDSANLVLSYGRRAVEVLGGRGIGPRTASRILSRSSNEEGIYMGMMAEERRYIVTRRFWSR